MPRFAAVVMLVVGLAALGAGAMPLEVGQEDMAPGVFPVPFTRPLSLTEPPMNGTDVMILQHLLARSKGGRSLPATTVFDSATETALARFQGAERMRSTGVLDAASAAKVLALLSEDGYKDDGRPAQEKGFLYKVYVPVHRNRSIETTATLFAGNGTALFHFRVRAHGHNYPGESPVWPNFNDTDAGINQFSRYGQTPTGLATMDLNSPEDEPKFFGPYPVNRMLQGLEGNAAFLTPDTRFGILLHTGEWSQYSHWAPPQVMPNSAGCMHAWPSSIERIWHELVALGVQVRPNTGGKLPYPYKAQGLVSVELID